MPHEASEQIAERLRVHHRAHRAAVILEDDLVSGEPAQRGELVPRTGDVPLGNEIRQEHEAVVAVAGALLLAQLREVGIAHHWASLWNGVPPAAPPAASR